MHAYRRDVCHGTVGQVLERAESGQSDGIWSPSSSVGNRVHMSLNVSGLVCGWACPGSTVVPFLRGTLNQAPQTLHSLNPKLLNPTLQKPQTLFPKP